MIFQIFTPGNFPDTNLASDPVTRVPENINKKKEPLSAAQSFP
jgi:hypothetical protein